MYLYTINRPSYEENIAELECSFLTHSIAREGYAISSKRIDMSLPAYIEMQIEILYVEDSLCSLYDNIKRMNYKEDGYCVKFINISSHTPFAERKKIEREISDIFIGGPDLKNPIDEFIITKIDEQWYFGKKIANCTNRWLIYNKKPYTFCSSLPARMSRALVNIACCTNKDLRLVDPCCGMGSILLEALDMGISSKGYDVNQTVVLDANKNLKHYGFKEIVSLGDAKDIKENYDVAIADLPYGVLSKNGSDNYEAIIKNLRNICDKLIILSCYDISNILKAYNFNIVTICIVHKGGLDRHITICT